MPASATTTLPSNEANKPLASRRRDRRIWTISAGLLAIAIVGYLVSLLPGRGVDANSPPRQIPTFPVTADNASTTLAAEESPKFEPLADPRTNPAAYAEQMRRVEAQQRLREAEAMLGNNRYDEAIAALQRLLQLQPDHVEARVKMGFALIGKEQYRPAFQYLMQALDRDAGQADAYFGIAIVQEAVGNLEGALGGMRAFLHLTPNPDPQRLRIAQARAAIWEWEAKLGRGPWGPTRGVPPDFTEAELRRDGKGVGMKVPTRTPVGNEPVPYEIKSAEKKEIFRR